MSRPLAPSGGNDDVMTPRYIADAIIAHYKPAGRILEPCRGMATPPAFHREGWDWCEVKEGVDFLSRDFGSAHYDWVVTNPPWSLMRPFLRRSMEVADNVVFLCLINAFWMKARLRDMNEMGFAIKEILMVETPPKPWPQTGFALGATHIQRGYKGDVRISQLPVLTAHP